jgi:Spy/CpxP family protein refolding chaperone
MKNKISLTLAASLALGGMLLLSQPAAAAKGAAADDQAKAKRAQNLKAMGTELDLTAEQKTQLKPLLQEQKQKLQALKADTTLDKRAKAAKLKELQGELEPKLKEILTKEQFEKWQKHKETALAEKKQQRKQTR